LVLYETFFLEQLLQIWRRCDTFEFVSD